MIAQKDLYIYTYILKICSRCNLNCSYCFVYNKGDDTWRGQPKFMSADTVRQTCRRIREHCRAHGQHEVHLILHGGEPLLGGLSHIREICRIAEEELGGAEEPVEYRISVQSNGLLFTPALGDFFLEQGISMGVSIDGPPDINDRTRVYRNGRGSTGDLEKKLELLSRPPYNNIFGGFLVVIDIDSDPIDIFDYLAAYNPWGMDFLLPYDNWDRRPKGKEDFDSTPYADWLIRLFDHYIACNSPVHVKSFDSIMKVVMGGHSNVESIGVSPVDIVVVETNGDIEAVDSLKASFHGATRLGLHVNTHGFDDAMAHAKIRMRLEGAQKLCKTCRQCPIVQFCGAGYIPTRYSAAKQFDNPSIYCRDLYKLIDHIYDYVEAEIRCLAIP